MQHLFKPACLVVMTLLCGAASARSPETVPAVIFPVLVSYDLDKTKVTLPHDLEGGINLLLISFEREQQKDVNSWLPVTKEIELSHPGLRHYMLPVFAKENFLYRWWINSSLRSDLPADQQRRFTIPLHINRQNLMQTLQIESDHEITLLLIDKDGRVLWRAVGEMTEAKKQTLATLISGSKSSDRE